MPTDASNSEREPAYKSWLGRVVDVRPGEWTQLAASFAYFFCVLCAYYIIRPLREDVSARVDRATLTWLFTVVFVVMVAAVPAFGFAASRLARKRIVPAVYGFFVLNLFVFWLVFADPKAGWLADWTFYVWVSVFNLFVVSLFWSVMSDSYSSEQAKRLYGFIAAGGSVGAVAGPLLTQSLVQVTGTRHLLLLSMLFLCLGLVAAIVVMRGGGKAEEDGKKEAPGAKDILSGALRVAKSPFLMRIALWVFIANLLSTYFYFEATRAVGEAYAVDRDRVQLFSRMDLAVSVLTILSQIFLTKEAMQRLGISLTAAALPISATIGFLALALSPTLAVLVTIIVAERALTFAFSNPGLRVLFTTVSPDDKYKTQNFIDTVVFRGGDAASGWLFNWGLKSQLGLSGTAIAILALPAAIGWVVLSFMLGRSHAEREARESRATAKATVGA